MRVTVEAYGRLHLGFLNLSSELGWNYGSLGIGLDTPKISLTATSDTGLIVEGEHGDRILRFARKLSEYFGTEWQARLEVRETIPAHSGLGSGTQWAMAVGTALLRLHNMTCPPRELAWILGRGGRSGIGISSFEAGGFILETGHKSGESGQSTYPAQVVLRREFPKGWRFVLALADASPGLSGKEEANAFATLGDTRGITDVICRIVLLRLLPALIEEDIVAFGKAMSEIDQQTGLFFYQAQGGVYRDVADRLVAGLLDAGAYGVGQSSWGPCLYALVDDANEDAVVRVAQKQFEEKGWSGQVIVAGARNTGADVRVEEEVAI